MLSGSLTITCKAEERLAPLLDHIADKGNQRPAPAVCELAVAAHSQSPYVDSHSLTHQQRTRKLGENSCTASKVQGGGGESEGKESEETATVENFRAKNTCGT